MVRSHDIVGVYASLKSTLTSSLSLEVRNLSGQRGGYLALGTPWTCQNYLLLVRIELVRSNIRIEIEEKRSDGSAC